MVSQNILQLSSSHMTPFPSEFLILLCFGEQGLPNPRQNTSVGLYSFLHYSFGKQKHALNSVHPVFPSTSLTSALTRQTIQVHWPGCLHQNPASRLPSNAIKSLHHLSLSETRILIQWESYEELIKGFIQARVSSEDKGKYMESTLRSLYYFYFLYERGISADHFLCAINFILLSLIPITRSLFISKPFDDSPLLTLVLKVCSSSSFSAD